MWYFRPKSENEVLRAAQAVRSTNSACQKTSLWETDSPDTGEVALAPEGERWPEGPEGESLAFA